MELLGAHNFRTTEVLTHIMVHILDLGYCPTTSDNCYYLNYFFHIELQILLLHLEDIRVLQMGHKNLNEVCREKGRFCEYQFV